MEPETQHRFTGTQKKDRAGISFTTPSTRLWLVGLLCLVIGILIGKIVDPSTNSTVNSIIYFVFYNDNRTFYSFSGFFLGIVLIIFAINYILEWLSLLPKWVFWSILVIVLSVWIFFGTYPHPSSGNLILALWVCLFIFGLIYFPPLWVKILGVSALFFSFFFFSTLSVFIAVVPIGLFMIPWNLSIKRFLIPRKGVI